MSLASDLHLSSSSSSESEDSDDDSLVDDMLETILRRVAEARLKKLLAEKDESLQKIAMNRVLLKSLDISLVRRQQKRRQKRKLRLAQTPRR